MAGPRRGGATPQDVAGTGEVVTIGCGAVLSSDADVPTTQVPIHPPEAAQLLSRTPNR
jgi:hypothetical protein